MSKRVASILVLFGILGAAVGLFSSSLARDPSALIVQIPWDNQFQFAGFYEAEWQGFFEEEGLLVVLRPPFGDDGSMRNGIQEVVTGQADIGVGAADVLLARDQGRSLTIIMSIFQRSPIAVFSRVEAGITAPADLVDIRLWRRPGYLPDAELLALLRHEGIAENDLRNVIVAEPQQRPFSELAAGRIDAYAGYGLTAFWRAKQEGIDLSALLPASYGVDFYGDSLFTTETFARENQEVIARFKRALRKGWAHALANKTATAKRIAQDMPRRLMIDDLEGFNIFQADIVERLMMHPFIDIGQVNPERWRRMHAVLAQVDLVEGPFHPNTVYDAGAWAEEASRRTLSIMMLAGVAVLAVLIIAGFWVFLLRRTVARRTSSLRKEIEQRIQTEEELKTTFSLFQSLIDEMPQFIYRLGQDRKLEFINKAYLTASGLDEEDLLGKSAHDLSPPDLADRYEEDNNAVFEKGEVVTGIQEHYFPNTAGSVYVEYLKIPVRDNSGEIIGLQGIFWDVSERIQQQDELKSALIKAEEASTSKSLFLANMSHELRTPLNSILGFSEIIETETFGQVGIPKYREYAADIHYSAAHLLSLINDILDISKVESGELTVEEEELNFEKNIRECIKLLEPKIEQKKLELKTSFDRGAQWIFADRRIVRQVVLNLLSNAVKFTGEGGDITVSSAVEVDGSVAIRVRDSGVGISKEDLEILFEPFVQANNTPMLSNEGTGLGLALSRRLAATHDAIVTLDSELGVGTIATFHLPPSRRIDRLPN